MDEIDRKLMAELNKNCRISYQELSRIHGISANAIRHRILNLEENGEIAGYSVHLSPAMMGAEHLFGFLSTDGSRDEIEMIDEIGAHPNVIAAAAYSNGTYAFVGEYRNSEEFLSIGSHIRKIDCVHDSELHPIIGQYGSEIRLTNLHLRVLKPLLQEPRMPVIEVAKESGLSARRVRKLLDQLEESGAVKFRALIELGAARGIPFLARILWGAKKTTHKPIYNWITSNYSLIHWESFISATEPVLFSLLTAENLTHVTNLTREIRAHSSVKNVISIINQCHKYFRNYLHEKLREMIAALDQ